MKTVDEDSKTLTFLPLNQATVPPVGLIEHIKDHWWCVHPTKGLAFYKGFSAQANTNEEIAKRLAQMYPWCEVRFFPSVFRRINPGDYC